MGKCVVSGCPNRELTGSRGTFSRTPKRFFSFPEDPARVKVWLAALRETDKQDSTDEHLICEDHFLPEDVSTSGVSGDAIPIMPPFLDGPMGLDSSWGVESSEEEEEEEEGEGAEDAPPATDPPKQDPGGGLRTLPGGGLKTLPGGGLKTLPGGGLKTLPGGGLKTSPGGGLKTLPGGGLKTLPGGDLRTLPGGGLKTLPGGGLKTLPGGDLRTLPGGDLKTLPGGGLKTLPGGGLKTLPGGGLRTLPGGGLKTLPGGGLKTLPGGGLKTLPGGGLKTSPVVEKIRTRLQPQDETIRPQSLSREDVSLGLLTQRFLELLLAAPDGSVDLHQVVTRLQTDERRLHDVTKVLDGIALIENESDDRIRWKGKIPVSSFLWRNREKFQMELENLKLVEASLDGLIKSCSKQLFDMTDDVESSALAYVTHEDVSRLRVFQQQTLIIVKAPDETKLEIPAPKEDSIQVHLTADCGPIMVLTCDVGSGDNREKNRLFVALEESRIRTSSPRTGPQSAVHSV